MCGIGGVLGHGLLPDAADLARTFACGLAHRGPDGNGILGIEAPGGALRPMHGNNVAEALSGLLVHARLSIIDLATGDQPMMLADAPLAIVFNGEIYNYRELRSELERARGIRFRTQSDTEVILQVYRQWGAAGFGRLNGIFALALYDGNQRELVLARDPIGVKPLYWTRNNSTIGFASEIRPLHQAGLADRTLDQEALAQYLFYRFVPAPRTLWAGVRKVLPGHALTFDHTGELLREVDFARPAPVASSLEGRELIVAMAEEFRQAIRRQMLADVPVGAFLSGGLDSSLVVRAMADVGTPVATFAVGFPSRPERPSELVAARRAAALLGTAHRERELALDDYLARMAWAVAQVEEPLAHPGMLMQADLAALARTDVKVVLTGQGADEPLGGYPRHQAARLASLLGSPLGPVARLGLRAGGTGRESPDRLLRALGARRGIDRAAALFSPGDPAATARLVKGHRPGETHNAILSAIEPWWRRSEGMDEVARVLYVDVRTSLSDDLLLVGDKMAMAHGLEARVPFLDLDYLHFVEAIPGSRRVRAAGDRKWLQRELATALLPPELARELAGTTGLLRRKRGFDVPMDQWLRKDGPALVSFLLGSRSLLPEVVEPEWVRQVAENYLARPGQSFRTVLSLYMLELWLETTSAAPVA